PPDIRDVHSFPTRRSSVLKFRLNGFIALLTVAIGVALWGASTGNLAIDGENVGIDAIPNIVASGLGDQLSHTLIVIGLGAMVGRDRKSTRLNYSHVSISYA